MDQTPKTSKHVHAIKKALRELTPSLVRVKTTAGEKAVMVIREDALIHSAATSIKEPEDNLRHTLNIMIGLGVLKRYTNKNGLRYINAGIGEQG
jgi:hypothetical protein